MRRGALATLAIAALSYASCGPKPSPTPSGHNAKQLWIAPNGSLYDLYLTDVEPDPF